MPKPLSYVAGSLHLLCSYRDRCSVARCSDPGCSDPGCSVAGYPAR
ncbi:MAG TPA: hypothetical protein PLQ57_13005 [Saprospiraceae bacterium]|nr:hypothetical protein [Saprospiraceae bacterium]